MSQSNDSYGDDSASSYEGSFSSSSSSSSGGTLPKAEKKPHYSGHRDRLRERFLHGGIDALAEYELLELILFMAIPRRDVKPLAKELINKFGNFASIINAPDSELRKITGLSDGSITALKIIKASSHFLLSQELKGQPVINNWDKLIKYCTVTMAHETREHFRLLFLNRKNELIADEIQQSGTIDHTPAYPREIMKRALELGATAIILVHNHPSGDPNPSQGDIEMTKNIIEAGKPFSIVIHDHVIVSRNGHKSFRALGLI